MVTTKEETDKKRFLWKMCVEVPVHIEVRDVQNPIRYMKSATQSLCSRTLQIVIVS